MSLPVSRQKNQWKSQNLGESKLPPPGWKSLLADATAQPIVATKNPGFWDLKIILGILTFSNTLVSLQKRLRFLEDSHKGMVNTCNPHVKLVKLSFVKHFASNTSMSYVHLLHRSCLLLTNNVLLGQPEDLRLQL